LFLPETGEKMPSFSERKNIVVIADEAHRSQYDLIDGLARHRRDSLAANDSAVQAMGNAKLKAIAAELITKVRQSVTH